MRNRLRELRLERSMYSDEFADFLQVGHNDYAEYEAGKVPELEMMIGIAFRLKLNPDEIWYTNEKVELRYE